MNLVTGTAVPSWLDLPDQGYLEFSQTVFAGNIIADWLGHDGAFVAGRFTGQTVAPAGAHPIVAADRQG